MNYINKNNFPVKYADEMLKQMKMHSCVISLTHGFI